MTDGIQELDEILANLVNQVAANEQRLLNGNATREETIDSDSDATMRAEEAIQAYTSAEIAKVLDRLISEQETEAKAVDGEVITYVLLSDIEAERNKLEAEL